MARAAGRIPGGMEAARIEPAQVNHCRHSCSIPTEPLNAANRSRCCACGLSCWIVGTITPIPLTGCGAVALRRQGSAPRAVRVGRESAVYLVGA
jgi:hypothetical protein